jgi:regulator of nonsense transcripts 1
MPRGSPDNPTATQPLLFNQNLVDEPIDSIELRFVHEKDLEADPLQWLLGLDENSPRSVGISPAYSKSGDLQALACALDTRVLVIKFHSTRSYDGGAPGSGAQSRNVERRALLEEELLCHPLCTLYAFDLAPLALSLHLHFHIRLTDAIDIQSALQPAEEPDRSVTASVQIVIGDESLLFSDNILRAFENMNYQSSKLKDLTDLGQRAWLCSYIGRYDFEAIREMFYKVPKVDTARFSQEVRRVFLRMGYTVHLTTSFRQGIERSSKNGI